MKEKKSYLLILHPLANTEIEISLWPVNLAGNNCTLWFNRFYIISSSGTEILFKRQLNIVVVFVIIL